jgi:Uncharacterized protein conserved in bacteria
MRVVISKKNRANSLSMQQMLDKAFPDPGRRAYIEDRIMGVENLLRICPEFDTAELKMWNSKEPLMNQWQEDVLEFHKEMDQTIGQSPAIRDKELRKRLIREEAKELLEAIEKDDLVKAIDAMCDLIYVVNGAAVAFGVNLQPFWEEVHRTNMAKKDGPIDANGKKLKPEDWSPPDIKGILQKMIDSRSGS